MKYLALIIVALGCLPAMADQWTYFYPETVQRYGCTVTPVVERLAGSGLSADYYQAEAWAERKNGSERDSWRAVVADYSLTPKGRHAAQKACSKWMDEAEKRIRRVQ